MQKYLLTKNNLTKLLNNEIPCIYLPGFSTKEECASLSEAAEYVGFENYLDVFPPIGRIGITQFEAKKFDKEWYFNRSAEIALSHEAMFKRSFNPLERIRNLLINNGDMEVSYAQENDKTYCVGLLRQINNSALIHADYAPFDAPDWTIGKINAQFAWNLCVSEPEEGGECIVYNKQWEMEDESLKIENSYGYSPKVIEFREHTKIKINVGDAYLFNSRNFHEVSKSRGMRTTFSCFFGRIDEKKLVMWS